MVVGAIHELQPWRELMRLTEPIPLQVSFEILLLYCPNCPAIYAQPSAAEIDSCDSKVCLKTNATTSAGICTRHDSPILCTDNGNALRIHPRSVGWQINTIFRLVRILEMLRNIHDIGLTYFSLKDHRLTRLYRCLFSLLNPSS